MAGIFDKYDIIENEIYKIIKKDKKLFLDYCMDKNDGKQKVENIVCNLLNIKKENHVFSFENIYNKIQNEFENFYSFKDIFQ